MARVLSIFIDPEECTCSQACVLACPEVLDGNTENNVPRVREGAEQFFETLVENLKMAADVCPVEAVHLTLDTK